MARRYRRSQRPLPFNRRDDLHSSCLRRDRIPLLLVGRRAFTDGRIDSDLLLLCSTSRSIRSWSRIPALAVFERAWLFSESKGKKEVPVTAKSLAIAADKQAAASAATTEDYQAWLSYVAKRNPSKVKRGMTLKDEYEEWMVTRMKNRRTVS